MFKIYHWDTFDNTTILLAQTDTLEEAKDFVTKRYIGRIQASGADQVDIVDNLGNVVESYKVG